MAEMQAAAWAEAQRQVESEGREKHFELRGANLAIQTLTDPEVLVCGARGTGKTLGRLVLMHWKMRTFPGARGLIVRKVRADLAQTALVTFERDVLGLDNPICAGVQREQRQAYRYPNGSEIVVGGMDRPGKMLSGEYDDIYPVEGVQFTDVDWDFFVMSNRNGVVPYQQVIADTNPDHPKHWLKQRCDAGGVKLLNTYHRDNPRYWDASALNGAGDWTADGRAYVVDKLGKLTGVRRKRFLDNIWAVAEGAVYDTWDEAVHLIDRFDIPADWRRFRSIDFGYTNPLVCAWFAQDHDGRLYLYREIYMTQRTVRAHAEQIKRLSEGERIEATVADHDAEDRATLRECGIPTTAAKKEISVGIQAVQERLLVAGDGKPRLFILRGALVERDEGLAEAGKPVSTVEEFPAYVWPKGIDGKPMKEVPVDEDNHGMDCVRYLVRHVDGAPVARVRPNPIYGG